MDRLGPSGKVSKKLGHLLRWITFPGLDRSDRSEFWLNGSRPRLLSTLLPIMFFVNGLLVNCLFQHLIQREQTANCCHSKYIKVVTVH